MDVKNILIVDDDEEIIKLLSITLKDLAQEIFVGTDGQEALDLLALHSNYIHCIVSDIKMPTMDGITFLENVIAKKYDIPFFFFTAFGDSGTVKRAKHHRVEAFIAKPNVQEVKKLVKDILNK